MCEEEDKPYVKNLKKAQDRVSDALLRGQTTRQRKKTLTWKVTTPTLPRQRSLDVQYGTIYCMKSERLVDKPVASQCLERELTDCSSLNLDSAREKLYIRESSEGNKSRSTPTHRENKRLTQYVIKEYKEPLNLSNTTYATPRLASRDQPRGSISEVVDLFVKEHSGYKVKCKRQRIKRCKQQNVQACQFCDVLGPVTCAMCIERTDRHFAQRAEEKTLPAMEMSVSNLVASGLSKAMEKGVHLMQSKEDHFSNHMNVVNLPPI